MCNILPGFYFINEYGVIASKKAGNMRFKTDKDGYYRLSLCTNELTGEKEHKRKMFGVANLVLREFGGDPPSTMSDPTVEHKDGNKQNNHISNLCWMERSENASTRKQTSPGEKNASAKLTKHEVAEIKRLLRESNMTLQQIGDMFNVHKSTINNIKRNKTWAFVQEGD